MSQVQPVDSANMYGLEGTPLERVEKLRDVIIKGGNEAHVGAR